jgi:glutamate decarboxylase
MRLVPMEGDRFNLSAEEAVKLCDENTIGVVAIVGSTFDGSYEPVDEICNALDDFEGETDRLFPSTSTARRGIRGAVRRSDLEWDFRLPRVASINARGTSTGSSTPAWAGSCGATRTRCRTT